MSLKLKKTRTSLAVDDPVYQSVVFGKVLILDSELVLVQSRTMRRYIENSIDLPQNAILVTCYKKAAIDRDSHSAEFIR